jgi:hypothetical protein
MTAPSERTSPFARIDSNHLKRRNIMKKLKSVAVIGGGCDRNRSNLDGSEAARLLFRCGLFCRLLRLLIWLNEEPETRF